MALDHHSHTYRLNKLEISSNFGKRIDISNLFTVFHIYENIFSPFLLGTLVLEDTLDIIKNLPIVGNEKILFSFNSNEQENSYDLEFYIYKIDKDNKIYGGDAKKVKTLTIFLCTKDALSDKKIKLSKKFSGTGSDIINNILNNHLNSSVNRDINSTTNQLEIYSNFWNPSKVINFICDNSTSNEHNDFIFYQTLEGYKFKSISSLLQNNVINQIKYQELKSKISKQDIQNYTFNSYFDHINNFNNGSIGKTLYKYNLINNTFEKEQKTILEITDKYTILGNKLNIPESIIDSEMFVELENYNLDTKLYKDTIINHLKNYNITCQFGGDAKRQSGQLFEFSGFNIDNISELDINFSGKWFSLAVCHVFNIQSIYYQNIKLVKNGFFNLPNMPIPNGKINV